MMSRFKINNDLYQPQFSDANAFHFFASALLAFFAGFWIAWAIGTLWEIGDGFKKWYWEAPPEITYAKFPSWNWVKRETLYSDKFSMQDWLIWDLGGSLAGALLVWILFRGI